jgi:phospholipase/carboxylesterase
MAELDGPRLEPRSGRARQLVVFLHGYGADGNDLIEIGRAWQGLLPDAAFVSPHAPRPCGQAPMGREWFPLTFRNPEERWTGVNDAGPVLERFLDSELKRRNLPPSALALVGFSQGTMMALHVGLRRNAAPAAIVGFSGVIAGPEMLRAETTCRPPVQLIHGSADDMIPVEACHLTREALAAEGLLVEWHIRPGLGHGIDPQGLAYAGRFLSERLGGF